MKKNNIVSLRKLHKVYSALDKHFALENYNLYYTTLIYKKKPACRVFLCWRVSHVLYDRIFSLRSIPLRCFPSWLKLAFDHERVKRSKSCESKKNEKTIK